MAEDVSLLARAMDLEVYSVLGHSFGAIVALQHACDDPGAAAKTIVSSGLPSLRYRARVDETLAAFEPVELREQVTKSWADEQTARTSDDVARLLHHQMPFYFKDPYDPRIKDSEAQSAHAVYSPAILQQMSLETSGTFDLEARLPNVIQPVLILTGRHDRTCDIRGAEANGCGDSRRDPSRVRAVRPHELHRGERQVPRCGQGVPHRLLAARWEERDTR